MHTLFTRPIPNYVLTIHRVLMSTFLTESVQLRDLRFHPARCCTSWVESRGVAAQKLQSSRLSVRSSLLLWLRASFKPPLGSFSLLRQPMAKHCRHPPSWKGSIDSAGSSKTRWFAELCRIASWKCCVHFEFCVCKVFICKLLPYPHLCKLRCDIAYITCCGERVHARESRSLHLIAKVNAF